MGLLTSLRVSADKFNAQQDLYPLSLLHTCSWLLLELPHDDAYGFLEQDMPADHTSHIIKKILAAGFVFLSSAVECYRYHHASHQDFMTPIHS